MTEPTKMIQIDFPRFFHVCLRQAKSGVTPINNTSVKNSGPVTRLKYGGPTVILVPVTSSEMSGKTVPHNTAKEIARKSMFCNTKALSRETKLSSECSDSSVSQRR